MSKIKGLHIPNEGDVLTAESIKDLGDKLEIVDSIIDEENFREEGLDWRVFEDGATVEPHGLHRGPITCSRNLRLSHDVLWKVPVWPSGSISGGYSSTTPRLDFEWDPEKDTDVIIRVSLQANSAAAGNLRTHVTRQNEAWEFGLFIIKPGDPLEIPSVLKHNTPNDPNCVYPVQRMMLNNAFSGLRGRGHVTRGEYNDGMGVTEGSSLMKARAMYVAGGFQRYYGSSSYPAGQWDQYGYDRSSRMSQSFTMIAHGSSNRSRQELNFNVHSFLEAGTCRVYLVYRSKYSSPGKSSYPIYFADDNRNGSGIWSHSNAGTIGIDSLVMSYQIIRR